MKQRKLFSQRGPVFYQIALRKEYLLRDIHDVFSEERFCSHRGGEYPTIVKGHRSLMLRQLEGVDMQLQHNKVHNLGLAAAKIDGIVVQPGETFSFWRMVGRAEAKQGYLPGMTITSGKSGSGVGGGLCQLANLIHWMVLHSPLTVTELHHHSDSLFPDSGRRVPFGTGTSVFYKNVDYRFCNNTDRAVQLRIWQEEGDLCGELRTVSQFPNYYRIEETGHHFAREDDQWYRNSRIYKLTLERGTNRLLRRELILQNHSRVMYDPALIPTGDIWTAEMGPYPWEEY